VTFFSEGHFAVSIHSLHLLTLTIAFHLHASLYIIMYFQAQRYPFESRSLGLLRVKESCDAKGSAISMNCENKVQATGSHGSSNLGGKWARQLTTSRWVSADRVPCAQR
jgi:hypothetical protein